MSRPPVLVRVGLPKPGGSLVEHAKAKNYPILLSANCLAVRDKEKNFKGWRTTLSHLEGMDVALDSAGFVAWAHYGGFPWDVSDYLDLAESHLWAWWAQMDACCEPEIAKDRNMVRLRQAETIRLLSECEQGALERGLKPPMKVLQGASPEDYVWHAQQVINGTEKIVGVGSMCRRVLHGENGLLAVVAALDAVLPPGVKLHLFGIKSAGLAALAYHPRVTAVDSMAWSVASRKDAHKAGASNTIARKTAAMDFWVGRQRAAVLRGARTNIVPQRTNPRAAYPQHIINWAQTIEQGHMSLKQALPLIPEAPPALRRKRS